MLDISRAYFNAEKEGDDLQKKKKTKKQKRKINVNKTKNAIKRNMSKPKLEIMKIAQSPKASGAHCQLFSFDPLKRKEKYLCE